MDSVIIDAFTFYDELDMLEFRFKELYETVDKFIISEATNTFAGAKRDLIFNKNKSKYKKYLDKVYYVIVDDMPNNGDYWANESYQREAIAKKIYNLNLKSKDVIILSDVDEIPDVNELKKIKKRGLKNSFSTLLQYTYFYNINNKALAYSSLDKKLNRKYHIEHASKIFYYSAFLELQKENISMHAMRAWMPDLLKYIKFNDHGFIEKGGWHLTNFKENKTKEKLINYCVNENGNIKIPQAFRDITNILKKIQFENIECKDNNYLPIEYSSLNF